MKKPKLPRPSHLIFILLTLLPNSQQFKFDGFYSGYGHTAGLSFSRGVVEPSVKLAATPD